jgi:hypothetical protein
MAAHSTGGTVTFFAWKPDRGLVETVKAYHSLDDLFAHCLSSGQQGYVEEVLIAGVDRGCVTDRNVNVTSIDTPLDSISFPDQAEDFICP